MSTTNRGHRKISIEILRIVAMMLVLACHSVIHLNWGLMSASVWKLAVSNMVVQSGQLGVAVFFMITGYFCVNKEQQYLRLPGIWIQVVVYGLFCLCIVLVARAFGLFESLDGLLSGWGFATTLKKELMPITSHAYWFMTSYFCIMLLSPFIYTLIRNVKENVTIGLVAVLVLSESSFFDWLGATSAQLVQQGYYMLLGWCHYAYVVQALS